MPLIAVKIKPLSAELPNDLQPKQSLSAVNRSVQEVAEELRIILHDASNSAPSNLQNQPRIASKSRT